MIKRIKCLDDYLEWLTNTKEVVFVGSSKVPYLIKFSYD